MRFQGKTIIVTGGAQGIGRACVQAFAAEGGAVVIADLAVEAGEALAREIAAAGGKARFVRTDVGDARDAGCLVDATLEWACGLDVLVNNAGIIKTADFLELSEADFDAVLRVNLKGPFLVGQAAARVMAARGGGAIVNMSSANAVLAIPNQVPYVTSKGGLNQLTKVMALALADKNIRVNAVGPGSITTDILKVVMHDEEARRRILSRTPMGRTGEPDGGRQAGPVPRQRRCQLHHRPVRLHRRRPHGAELHRAGQGLSAGIGRCAVIATVLAALLWLVAILLAQPPAMARRPPASRLPAGSGANIEDIYDIDIARDTFGAALWLWTLVPDRRGRSAGDGRLPRPRPRSTWARSGQRAHGRRRLLPLPARARARSATTGT